MSRVCILAKAPLPGMVKTRMCPPLTQKQAAHLQRRLLARTVQTVLQSNATTIELWTALDHRHKSFFDLLAQHPSLITRRQAPGDLGKRMSACFNPGNDEVTVVVGTDCPSMEKQHINTALEAAEISDCHFIPALDGGYVLVASTGLPQCFEGIQWGTDQVWRETQRALEIAGQSFSCQAALPDLDCVEDLSLHSGEILSGLELDFNLSKASHRIRE